MAENEQPSGSSPLNWQTLALLAAIASNLLWVGSPLRSSRPPERPSSEPEMHGVQDIEARLWQDPFQAVLAATSKSKAPHTDEDRHTLPAALERLKGFSTNDSVLVLLVVVPGAPYTAAAEWRLRSRNAVLSGLNVSGFVPSDPEHIGYFRFALPDSSAGSQTNLFPFEWLDAESLGLARATPVAGKHALLVWLKEELFYDAPLNRLAALVGAFKLDAKLQSSSAPQFKVLGPYGSLTLKTMYEQSMPSTDLTIAASNLLAGVEMYSPSATAADRFLVAATADNSSGEPRSQIKRGLANSGLDFINVICTDEKLCQSLVGELERRQLCPGDPNHGIALLSEEDTFYGRSLPAAFVEQLSAAGASRHHTNVVRCYSYFRGLDGKVAHQDEKAEDKAGDNQKPAGESQKQDVKAMERPEGNNQLDYVPRLADRINSEFSGHEWHARHTNESAPQLKAIGILGSDVYDKLLLLQSLRPRFPNVIFFTTDLDARLFHPAELKWSRNLIVASSFGLELATEMQSGVPPFRDGYQVAQFLAAQVAVGGVSPTNLLVLEPRLFEIGQRGAVDLSTNEQPWLYPPRENYGAIPDIFHLRAPVYLVIPIACLLFYQISSTARKWTLTILMGLAAPFSANLRGLLPPAFLRYWKSFFAALLIVLSLPLIFACLILKDYCNPAGEPVLLFDGMSVWPTEMIRFVTLLLCSIFIIRIWYTLETDRKQASQQYAGSPNTSSLARMPFWGPIKYHWLKHGLRPKSLPDLRKHLEGYHRQNLGITAWQVESSGRDENSELAFEKEVVAIRLFEAYEARALLRNRILRVLPVSLLYFSFAFCLIQLSRPFVPARGPLSFNVDKAIMMLLSISFVFLMFTVVDATRLCAKLVENLTASSANWDDQVCHLFQAKRCLPRAYLSEWIDIQFLAERSKVIVNLIYFPFIILLLMILARSHFFDAWDWPPGLVVLLGVNSAYAIYCGVWLRRAAERMRNAALGRLKEKLSLATMERIEQDQREGLCPTPVKRDDLICQLNQIIQEIQNTEEGAFAPWSRQPLVGALIMPFSGAGLLALLQYFAQGN